MTTAVEQCIHLQEATDVVPGVEGCEECLALGETWVNTRVCLTCGHVGCCNESPHRHAQQHFHETGHPVVRALGPDEGWEWCYVDKVMRTEHVSVQADDESSKEFLRQHQLFSGLSEEDLDRLYGMAMLVTVPAGETFIEEGDSGDSMYVVLNGEVEVTKRSGEQDVLLGIRGAGEIIGEMALLDAAPRMASVRATEDTQMLSISQAAFETLLACSTSAARDILRTMTSRLHNQQSLLTQQQKLVSLGTMSAGLAHELNNPAAAIRRSAAQLEQTLTGWEAASLDLGKVGASPELMEHVDALRGEAQARAGKVANLDPLERSEQEDAIADWLEDHDVDVAWELAPALLEAGWNAEALEKLAGDLSPEEAAASAHWLAARAATDGLLKEVRISSDAISAIVAGVKQYSYLDQAPVQEVDVRESLDNTLMILKHKLKNVRVTKEYAEDLPQIEAFGSELSQVWTNLIDNAVDAMEGTGELIVRAFPESDRVVVEIEDHGPGIPREIQNRVFDVFFTTKAPGKGTGQGLHVVHNIVTQRHRGRIDMHSQPGKTVFRVELPLRLRRT